MQIVRIGIANLNHAANAVDGRAQIVTHTTQKFRLCRVGRRGLARCLCQLVAIVAFLQQQVGQALPLCMAARQRSCGYSAAVEHQHAGNYNCDGFKVTPRGSVGVHVELACFAKSAQIPLAVGVDQTNPTGQAAFLNTVDYGGIRRRQNECTRRGGFNGIGRNNLGIVFDHDIAAIDGFIAIEQALQLERIARDRLGALVPYRNNDALAAPPSHAANVGDRIIRKRDAGGIGLKRMGRHLQHGCFFEIRSE